MENATKMEEAVKFPEPTELVCVSSDLYIDYVHVYYYQLTGPSEVAVQATKATDLVLPPVVPSISDGIIVSST